MKSLLKLVFSSLFFTCIAANAPPKAPPVAKDIKADWLKFVSNSENAAQDGGATTRTDVSQKEQIDNYFLNPLPEYEAFNKWFYKALDGGRKSIYEQIKKSYEDPNFIPQKTLTNTPFPIPSQFQRVYSWLITQDPFLADSALKSGIEHKNKIESVFSSTIKPIFNPFFEWLYGKREQDADWKQHVEDSKKLASPKSRDLASTPFAVPKKYHAYYYYEVMHPNKTISRYNYTITSNGTVSDENISKDTINEYFGGIVAPPFEDFYEWFYNKQQEDDQWLRELNLAEHFNFPTLEDTPYTTPFPIPPKYRSFYILSEMVYPNNTSTNSSDNAITLHKQLQKNEPVDENLINDFFGGTVDPAFKDFYNWFYEKQHEDDVWQKQLEMAKNLNLSDFDQAVTPFPVPEEYYPFYMFANMLDSPNQLPADLDNLLNQTNTLTDYEEFNKWLDEASPFHRNLLKKACELTLQPIKTSYTSTPFPVPEPLRDAFCWAISHDEVGNATDNPDGTFYRNELEKFFKKSHLPIHDLFYQWLYDVETDEERAKARQATKEPIHQVDFAKWFRFTPFPIPVEHLHNFAYINAVESLLNITTKSPKSSSTKAGTGIPGTKAYIEFTRWLNKVLNNDQNLLNEKIKECQRDQKFSLRNISTTTEFPVPLNHFRFYHWLNSHLEDLKKSTPDKSISPQASTPKGQYSEFAKWLQNLYDPNEVKQKIRECQADLTFQPRNIHVTAPFEVPLHYYRFYHWVNSKLHPEEYVTHEPAPTPKPFVFEPEKPSTASFEYSPIESSKHKKSSNVPIDQDNNDDESRPPTTPSYQQFTNWLNEVFDHKQELINQKVKECQHDQEFKPRDFKEPPPFPVPLRFYRFYHWLNAKIKAGEHKKQGIIHTAPPTRYDTTGKPGISFMTTRAFPQYTEWLFNLFKNDQKLINEKLKECQQDQTFNPRAILKVTTPFPVPIRHYRFYHWMNSKLNPDAYKYSSKEVTHPSPFPLEPTYVTFAPESDEITSQTEETTTDPPIPPTKSYIEFTKWLNEILNDDVKLIERKIKECQHDQEFNPREIKETTPFPVPIHHFRFYHWLNAKRKAGELKKEGIIHTAPAKSHATTGKPGVSFMTTRAFPEYTKWLFDLFKNDQKQIKEKLKECQQDTTFSPRAAINSSTPFPIPIRHYRFYHWMNSKLKSQSPSS